jgi:hypothetical protein
MEAKTCLSLCASLCMGQSRPLSGRFKNAKTCKFGRLMILEDMELLGNGDTGYFLWIQSCSLQTMFLVHHTLSNLRLPVLGTLETVRVALIIGHCLVNTLCAGLNERTVLNNLENC